jgi:hypothetical protein
MNTAMFCVIVFILVFFGTACWLMLDRISKRLGRIAEYLRIIAVQTDPSIK